MNIITVNNQQVMECPHCRGTGMCQLSHLAYGKREHSSGIMFPAAVLQCQRCGVGVFQYYNLETPSSSELTPPVCKICNGKGFNVI